MCAYAIASASGVGSVTLFWAIDSGSFQSTTMAAGVEENFNFAFLVAHENNRAASHAAGDKITGLFQLRAVANINPAFRENLTHFIAQNFVRHVHFAIEEEDPLFRIVDDIRTGH
jgi:hypothetical protein